ncbi:MAG: magnesium transporter, partial [Oscillospiraceae bacterium]|nr:magnesium transporter [Oscillospiraceae bacterium]
MPKELASETFAYIETEQQEQLISAFSDRELRAVVNELFLDDTVDLIEEMPASVVARILKNTDSETRKQINELLAYPDDSAGSLMTLEYVYFNQDTTVSEAFERIRQVGVAKETIYTCYVTERRRLVGVVSLLDMLTAETDTSIREIMDPNVISVTTLEDKEHVAAAFAKYDLLALPVVDTDNRLVGIVTVDDAI